MDYTYFGQHNNNNISNNNNNNNKQFITNVCAIAFESLGTNQSVGFWFYRGFCGTLIYFGGDEARLRSRMVVIRLIVYEELRDYFFTTTKQKLLL